MPNLLSGCSALRCFVLMLAFSPLAANAESAAPVGAHRVAGATLSAADEKQIIAVVQSQLQAFAAEDAEKAFSFAAPNIRALLGNAANFFEMVRSQYGIVVHPASVVFFKPRGEGGESMLKVQLTDEDGDVFTATYTLQRQKDKLWRITGCVITEAVGTMI